MGNAPSGPQPVGLPSGDRPVATPDRTLYLIGHAHLDPVWLWPWQEGYAEARATFASALARMEEYPDFVFTCDQVVLLSWVEESDPELFAAIQQRAAEGRWVNGGGWWVEPDGNLGMGEAFARQGLLGQRYLVSRFGRPATVGMNVDPFGHSAMLPQVLRGHGLDSYLFLRPGPHEGDLQPTLFWWEAPDGSRVLAYRIPYEYGSPPGPVDGQVEKSLASMDRSLTDAMVFYGVGNHGGGPTRANIDSIHRFDRMGSFGRLQMASPAGVPRRRAGRARAHRLAPGPPRRPPAPRARLLLRPLGRQGLAAPRAARRAGRRALVGGGRPAARPALPARGPRPGPGSRCCSTSSTTCCPARPSSPPTTTPATSSARRRPSPSGWWSGRTTSSPGRSTCPSSTGRSRCWSSTRTPGR